MFAFASRFSASAVCAALFFLPLSPAQAFGPQTHAWLAQRLLDDVGRDCRTAIAGRRYTLAPEYCAAIRENPADFMAGATATSNFPDPLTARLTLRQGQGSGWSSGQWLQELVQRANSPQALAFALGNVFQAGQEVFANSYVNAFAGAPFSLQASDDVLLRHVVLESYLDAHLPATSLVSRSAHLPLEFLDNFYLKNPQVMAQYRQLPATAHLLAMQDLSPAVQAAAQKMEGIHFMAAEMLAYYGRMPLSYEALYEEFGRQATTAQVADYSAGKASAEKEARWLNAKALQARQQAALVQADAGLKKLAPLQEAQRKKIALAEKNLLRLPSILRQEDCRNVRKWINSKEWTSHRVCQKTAVANPERRKAREQIEGHKQKLAALNMQQQRLTLQSDLAAASLAEAGQELQAADQARNEKVVEPDSLQVLLLRRAEAMRSLRIALSALEDFSALSQQWQGDIAAAERDFLQLAQPATQQSGSPPLSRVQQYQNWLACSGSVFLAAAKAETSSCRSEALPALQMQGVLERLTAALQVESLRPLREQYLVTGSPALVALREQLRQGNEALDAFVAPGSPLSRLVQFEAARPVSRALLQEVLASSGHEPSLLTVSNGAELVDADAGIRAGGALDAEAFNALQYGERFARMALLSGRELNRLAGRSAGWYFSRWQLHPEAENARYSLLFTALRSMDGNQQWQPYGLPYARTAGIAEPVQAAQRNFGYGPADGADAGLAIFINAEARQKVFRELFPRPLSLLETHPRLQAPSYPFPSCAANPFPVTFTRAGNAAVADGSCARRELVQH